MITDPRLDAMFRCPKCGEYLELDIFGNGKCPKCSFIEPGYEEIPEGLNVTKHQQKRKED
jgi:rubrerythrin